MTVTPIRHPAHAMPFDELADGLDRARAEKLVYERRGPDGLTLYVYAERCVYDAAWTPFTRSARGLILDRPNRRIVATPFPKFFNLGELGHAIPDEPFEAWEKLDGSLIIVYHHDGSWRAATKGAFASSQARWAQERLDGLDTGALRPGVTYLAEAVYPENRIVVRYEEPALVMLAAYDAEGYELDSGAVGAIAAELGWRMARRSAFDSVGDLVAHASRLPRSEEGFVIRFASGERLKVKGSEYKRIHALITGITPLGIWNLLQAGDEVEAVRRDIPEEFWADFDAIAGLLRARLDDLLSRTAALAAEIGDLTDKEVGLRLPSFDQDVARFLFPYRKSGGDLLKPGRNRDAVFRAIRPDGNVLPGYTPSYALHTVLDEASA